MILESRIGSNSLILINPAFNRNPDEIRTPARVIEVMRDRAYRLELSNGHRCIGRAEKDQAPLAEGAEVTVAFHPYDLARGWIVSPSFLSATAF